MRLTTVHGFVIFDLDGAAVNAGGTRFAPDVTEEETALLARAMTYKFALLGSRVGGAKAGIRGDPGSRVELLGRFCEEIGPIVASGRFLTGPDLGTSEADFAPLRSKDRENVMASSVGGVPLEDLLTGFGVVVAAEAALGSLDGASVAIEGFGKVGGGVAREAIRRGGRVVSVATTHGCVVNDAGLDVEMLLGLRRVHGDACVWHIGGDVREPPGRVFDVRADVLVPGARPGVITPQLAERLDVRAVVPAANVPYAVGSIDVLQRRGVRALPDFLTNAGAVIGYLQPATSGPGEVFREVERRISDLVQLAQLDPAGSFAGACRIAESFLATWRPEDATPERRPLVRTGRGTADVL